MVKVLHFLLYAFAIANFVKSASQHRQPRGPKRKSAEPVNNNIFEKVEYEVFNKTLIKDFRLEWRPLASNVFRYNVSVEITEHLNELWYNYRLFYKYTTYQKFLIDMNMDVCGILNKTTNNPLTKVLLANYMREIQTDGYHMNFKPECPFYGYLEAWSTGSNSSHYNFPLVPAGRYRVDLEARRTEHGPVIMVVRAFVRVSDLRIWF